MLLHILCEGSILYLRIAVDVFGLHLGEPDASGSFFIEIDIVVNLAALAGVRYSITNPDAYIEANLIGFYNILEACRHSYDGGAKGLALVLELA